MTSPEMKVYISSIPVAFSCDFRLETSIMSSSFATSLSQNFVESDRVRRSMTVALDDHASFTSVVDFHLSRFIANGDDVVFGRDFRNACLGSGLSGFIFPASPDTSSSSTHSCGATGVQLLTQVFMEPYSQLSPFSLKFDDLKNLVTLHGLTHLVHAEINAFSTAVLHHLLNGHCLHLATPTCSEFANGFRDRCAFADCMKQLIMNCSVLSDGHLRLMVESIGLNNEEPSEQSRDTLLYTLQNFYDSDFHAVRVPKTIAETFKGFHRLDRTQLIQIANSLHVLL
ncbi:hypothetical protein EV361DRAFT_208253 [Lentinula raphanica]|nr:hypothetical protein EV361DRAFT_208253 [Lentinula raphanica]